MRLYNGPFDGDANKPAVPWSTHPKGEVPDGYYTVPIGKAEIVRKGSAVTMVAYGTMIYVCEAAAKALQIAGAPASYEVGITDRRTEIAAYARCSRIVPRDRSTWISAGT